MPVKENAADKEHYLRENFTLQQLEGDVAKQMAGGGHAPLAFETIKVKRNDLYEIKGKTAATASVAVTVKNGGSGLIQEIMEYSSNGIPYGDQFSLSYMGLLPLRTGTVHLNRSRVDGVYEVYRIKRIDKDAIHPREDTAYVFDWVQGPDTMQIGGFGASVKLVCHAGKFYAATAIYSALPGKAIDFDCQREVNGVLNAKLKFVVLDSFGLALMTKYQDSKKTETYTIESVAVR